ncbi:MAG: NAD(P)H-dependent oxidoreductase [Acidobacteria bacterium]|nr:NAD(P)H-dependent oxidoreductase [Acidobacteriota bacterium]
MNLVLMGGSLRQNSLNGRFMEHVATLLEGAGHGAEVFSATTLRLPLVEEGLPMPEGLIPVARALTAAQGLVLVSPEYNAGIPGHLKNAVDWLSLQSPSPFRGLPVLLCACSPGALGGARGLLQWRATLANLGALALPGVVTVPQADRSLDARGAPTDGRTREFLRSALEEFLRVAGRLGDRGA